MDSSCRLLTAIHKTSANQIFLTDQSYRREGFIKKEQYLIEHFNIYPLGKWGESNFSMSGKYDYKFDPCMAL